MNMLEMVSTILFYGLIVACFIRAVVRTTRGLHILQLDGYKPGRYLKWVLTHIKNCFEIIEVVVIVGFLTIASVFSNIQTNWFFPAACSIWIAFQVYKIVWRKKSAAKKTTCLYCPRKATFWVGTYITCCSCYSPRVFYRRKPMAYKPISI